MSQHDVQDVLKAAREIAQEVIGTEVDTNAPLMSMGIDSLSAMEFTNAIAARFSMDLPPTVCSTILQSILLLNFCHTSYRATR